MPSCVFAVSSQTLVSKHVLSQGGTLAGITGVGQAGVAVLTLSRGTGPSKQTFWTSQWSAAGS
jgi:hypothetical protein